MTQEAGDMPARPAWLDHLGHDLRSPLAPLTSAVALLRGGRLDATQQAELLATMQRQLETLTQLIDDTAELLGRRGNGALAPTPVASLLDMAGVRVFRRLEEAGVAFEARVPEEPVAVACDARCLVRLVAQVTLIAAQAGGAGNRVIAAVDAEGAQVRLRVMLDQAVPDAGDALASLAQRWSNPAATHVADAAMRDILVRHGAQICPLPEATPGVAILMAAARAVD